MCVSSLPFHFASSHLHLNCRVGVFTFQPQRKSQIKSCLRCRGNPRQLTVSSSEGKLLSTVNGSISCRRTAAKAQNQILPVLTSTSSSSFSFSFFCSPLRNNNAAPYFHTKTRTLCPLLAAQILMCDTLVKTICWRSLLSSTRSLWRAHRVGASKL